MGAYADRMIANALAEHIVDMEAILKRDKLALQNEEMDEQQADMLRGSIRMGAVEIQSLKRIMRHRET